MVNSLGKLVRKQSRGIRLLAVAVACATLAAGEPPTPGNAELRESVRQLLALAKEEADAETAFATDKANLEARLRVAEDEAAAAKRNLEEQSAAGEAARAAGAETRRALAGEAEEVAALVRALPALEERLKSEAKRWPPCLRDALRVPLAELPEPGTPITPDNAPARLAAMGTILAEVKRFDAAVTLGSEILTPPDGKAREMDVLYLGLGAALAVDRTGTLAARANPGNEQAPWEWLPAAAREIRTAVDIYRKEKPAMLVPVPLRVGGVDE